MTKLLTYIFFSFTLFASETEGGLSFINIPTNSKANLLGNTLTSGLNNPGSLFQNPANIWNSSAIGITYTTRIKNIIQTKYQTIFLSRRSKRFNNMVFGLGYVDYGVDDIEEYNNENVFNDYFNWHDRSAGIGLSVKSLGILWGAGGQYIFRSTSYDPSYNENFGSFNLGLTVEEISLGIGDMALSYVITNTFGKDNDISTTSIPRFIIGSRFGTTLFKYDELKKVIIYLHSDAYRSHDPILFIRGGLELRKPIGKYGSITLGSGYRKYPILLDNEYESNDDVLTIDVLKEYNKKISYGILIDFNINQFSFIKSFPFSIIQFGYSSEINYGMNALSIEHITLEFSTN